MKAAPIISSGFVALIAVLVSGCNNSAENGTKKVQPVAEKRVVKKEPTPPREEPADTQVAETEAKPQPRAQVVVQTHQPAADEAILTPDLLDSDVPEVPPVLMSKQHEETCLVKVGDTMPDARLSDLSGREQELSKLLGDRLTVIFFWTATDAHSVEELADLAVKVASPLAAQGVRVVGICERDSAGEAQKTCDKAGVSYPVLLDSDGKYFSQVATRKMPRTYLVDGAGKILWFDIEYTRPTRHDLREALRALVSK